jgi:hypothetical protein
MSVDFITTTYALSHNIGSEGNGLMSGIVSNQMAFILTKLIGTAVIIFMMKNIIQRNEKYAYIGMRIITIMMLVVVANNLMVIHANALAFSPFVGATPGSINTGNGYYDNDGAAYGYSGDRNVYLVAESKNITLFEPISYNSGGTSHTLINSNAGTLVGGVVHNGYIYFVSGTTLMKKKLRNADNPCFDTDTGVGGCASIIATGITPTLRTFQGVLYFETGTVALHHLDVNDNQISDFTIALGNTGTNSFTVSKQGGVLHYYKSVISVSAGMFDCTATGCTLMSSVGGANPHYTTYFTMATHVYAYSLSGSGNSKQGIYLMSSLAETLVSYTTPAVNINNRAYVGSKSTIGLANTATTYYTFNAIEAGSDSLPTVPAQLIYTTHTINSLYTTYYNTSNIFINYNIGLNQLSQSNIFMDISPYRWMVVMTDPNGVSKDVYQTGQCVMSFLSTTCTVSETLEFAYPSNGWLNGTWSASLYEINTIVPNRALIATSPQFTVLNTSLENQSQISNPTIPITSGTAPQAISLIDGFVSWLGMGVNSVSKLLFAMILIGMMATIGLIYGNGNVAMVFAFIPYAFFTFIDYIPKWIFIITIILMAIVSKAFR